MAYSSTAISKSAGRYDGRKSNTRAVPNGRAQVNARLRTIQPVEAAVDDPFDGRERILVTVNRRVDILEMERSHNRITEAAYRTGQIVQAAFERLGWGSIGASNICGGSGSDPAMAVTNRMEKLADAAHAARKLMSRMERHLGMIDSRLLRRILGDRKTFAECADLQGKSGERGATYVASRFRDALEDLAVAWTAKGRLHPFDDRYVDEADPSSIAERRAAAFAYAKQREPECSDGRVDPTGKI